jgi:PKD repeat protein
MKKLINSLGLLLLTTMTAMSQNADDLQVTGYVTDADGMALNGQYVCVWYNGNNPAIQDSVCASTNANGWYSITVTNGSQTGPNQTFTVTTVDNCANQLLSEDVQNGQGSVNAVTVDFQTSCGANTGGGCDCELNIVSTITPDSSTYLFYGDLACGTQPFQYQWWIDGTESGDSIPSHVFTQEGAYGVGLTIIDANGCSFSAWDTVYVGDVCYAHFVYPSTPNGTVAAGTDIQFTFAGQVNNSASHLWTVSGGNITLTSSEMNPVFNFPTNGNYVVCVSVDGGLGCSDTFCTSVTATGGNEPDCQALFIDSVSTMASGWQVSFTDLSIGTFETWYWNFGDGNYSYSQNPVHVYTQPGQYTVCLIVIDSIGNICYDEYCNTIELDGLVADSCDAGFTFSGPTPNSNSFQFAANAGNNANQFVWDFGDGTMGSGPYVSHAYSLTTGTVSVCLTAYGSDIDTCTTCQTITFGQNNCLGYLSGQVFAGTQNQPLEGGIVYLITYDENTGMLAAMQATVTDSMGYYYFYPVACGDYLIKAAAGPNTMYYAGYLPTYYGNSLFWEYAQNVAVGQVNPGIQYDITLIAGNNPGGSGFIGGNVNDGANKVDGNGLEGVTVMLFDLSGGAIAYTYTDVNGDFSFDNLAYGSYQVYSEMAGYTTIPAVVNISAENPSIEDLIIIVSESLISTGVTQIDMDAHIGDVYPNPVNETAQVNFNMDRAHQVVISIVDLTGRVMASEDVAMMSGLNTYRFAVDGLSRGYFLLNVRDNNGTFNITRRFVVNR